MAFYVTTPIYYPNGAPHLGHAYSTVMADFLARYHRMLAEPTYFLTGTDENSQKIVREAIKSGRTPSEVLDENVERFKGLFADLDVSYDQFIRTTDKDVHWPGAIALWNRLVEKGDLYRKTYKGLYCVGAEAFVTEKDLRPGNLCPDHDEEPIVVEEENWFFRLSAYQDFLIDEIESDRLQILPKSRKNEILSFLREPLEDISFSRALKEGDELWGIPVPNDPTQTMYVWCDALANYVSGLGYGRERAPGEPDLMEEFWPASLHIIGKDILRFHAVYWPAMLHAAGLALPKAILVHGMITSGGRKMSKSIGNVIDPSDLVSEYGTEAVRLFLAKEMSPFEDPEITLDMFKNAYNAHLANGIGNLTNRVMKMAISYDVQYGDFSAVKAKDVPEFNEYARGFESFDVSAAMAVVWNKVTGMDKYIQDTEPFKMVKVDPEGAKEIVAYLVRQLYEVALLLEPVMPMTSRAMRECVLAKQMPEQALFLRKE
jgi:methionyl-tRNA synthetase